MKKANYVIVHCTATPPDVNVDKDWVTRAHLGPLDNKDGSVVYLGIKYKSRAHLRNVFPNAMQGGKSIHVIKGRGWRKRGYSTGINRKAEMFQIEFNNYDVNVSPWEITNGVSGINDEAIHVVLVGGVNSELKPENNFTPEMMAELKCFLLDVIKNIPDIQVAGHNQFAAKACPSFDVPTWARQAGIPERNICKRKM